jgi:hypothetical protein
MHFQIIIVLVVAALAAAVAYSVIGRVLPGRWRTRNQEQFKDFTLDSVNVLTGLLFSIGLAFDRWRANGLRRGARRYATRSRRHRRDIWIRHGIPEPTQSTWKRDSKNYVSLVINQDWSLMRETAAQRRRLDRAEHPAR